MASLPQNQTATSERVQHASDMLFDVVIGLYSGQELLPERKAEIQATVEELNILKDRIALFARDIRHVEATPDDLARGWVNGWPL